MPKVYIFALKTKDNDTAKYSYIKCLGHTKYLAKNLTNFAKGQIKQFKFKLGQSDIIISSDTYSIKLIKVLNIPESETVRPLLKYIPCLTKYLKGHRLRNSTVIEKISHYVSLYKEFRDKIKQEAEELGI